jgi:hypothetical protein
MVGADQNPTGGEFFVNIKWGRNVHKSGTGSVFKEDVLEGYKVVIVDSNMRMLQVVATVPKDGKPAENCCKMVYSKTVKGAWPTGGAKFMVVPYSTGTGAQDYENVPDSFILPMGQLGDFTDSKVGAGKVIQGTLALSVNNVKAIKKHQMGVVMQEAIAKTLPGIEAENVAITKITVTTTRRLGAASRKLSAGKVSVEYTIITPKAYSGVEITKEVIKQKEAELKTTVKETAKNLAIDVDVTAVVPEKVETTTMEVTTTTMKPTTTTTTVKTGGSTGATTGTSGTDTTGTETSGSVTSTAAASVFIAIFAAIGRQLLV